MDIDRGTSARRPERVSDLLLQELGRVAIADQLLRDRAARPVPLPDPSWGDRSGRLLDAVRSVMSAASRSPRAGATIAVVRQGLVVPVDERYLERLTQIIHRHVAAGDVLPAHRSRVHASS